MKNPLLQLKEAIFDINRMAYETDDFFKEGEAKLENCIEIRNHLVTGLELEMTDQQRKELKKGIDDLDFAIERIKEELRIYLDDYLKENSVKKEIEDEEKLNEAFERMRIAHERLYILHKHKRPDLAAGILEITFGTLTPDEKETFWENVRRREMDELDEILESAEADETALKP